MFYLHQNRFQVPAVLFCRRDGTSSEVLCMDSLEPDALSHKIRGRDSVTCFHRAFSSSVITSLSGVCVETCTKLAPKKLENRRT